MRAPARAKPVLRRTVAFLEDFFRISALHPGDRIPALPQLAVKAEVSYVTVVRAMRQLKASGIVALVNNHAYVLQRSPDGTAVQTPADQGTSPRSAIDGKSSRPWERAADRIRQDIVDRVFRPGAALPSQKEIQSRYRLSFHTLRKALDRLCDEGTLERIVNGGFAVPAFAGGAWRPTIVCLNQSPDSHTMAFGQNDEAVYRALELHCEQAGLSIDVILRRHDPDRNRHFMRSKTTGAILRTEDIPGSDDVLGFLYMIHQKPTEFDAPILQTLFARRKPIAVLDETALLELPPALSTSRQIRVFTTAVSIEPGIAIARHLLSLGHRRIAFVSMDHDAAWSRLRLQGLQAAFTSAGCSDAVVPFVQASDKPGRVVDEAMQRCEFNALREYYRSWRRKIPGEYRVDFDPAIEALRWNTCGQAELRRLLTPVLRKALADTAITAWVPVNDQVAYIAVDFLKDKGIRVPADLSLVSFDDTPEALRRSFSSYNFNAPAVADALVGFMLDRRPYNDPRLRISGSIVNRGTTGPARTRAN